VTHRPAVPILTHIRRLAAADCRGESADAVYLERFSTHGDETAFEALVRRHGPLVLRVCRAVLGDAHAAEDAFQATFLTLARRAAAVRKQPSLGNWLYKVAHHTALRARGRAASRLRREAAVARPPVAAPADEVSWREVQAIFFEEIAKLPERYRAPLLLCCWEGLARDEAAARLERPAGTVKIQLERGRKLLRERLNRRGLSLPAGLLAAQLAPAGAHAVPPSLLVATSRAGVSLRAGAGLQGLVSNRVLALSGTAAGAATAVKFAAGALVLICALAAANAGLLLGRITEADPPAAQGDGPPAPAGAKERTDAAGDPLPKGALLRLGSVRLRHNGNVNLARFTPDGKTLISQGMDGVRTWDVATGKPIRFVEQETRLGGQYAGSPLSHDGRLFVTAGKSGVDLWNLATAARVGGFGKGRYLMAELSPKGNLIAALTLSGIQQLEVFGLETGNRLWTRAAEKLQNINSIAITPDGKDVILAGEDIGVQKGILHFLDAETGVERRRISVGARAESVFHVGFSRDGSLMAAACTEGNVRPIRVWELASGKELIRLEPPLNKGTASICYYSSFAFAPDGKSLLTAGTYDRLIEWDLATGKERRRFGEGTAYASSLAYSPDGRTVAVTGLGATVRLLDAATGEDRIPGGGHRTNAYQAAFTPDGRSVVTSGQVPALMFWDRATGKPMGRLDPPDSDGCDLSPDGTAAISLHFREKLLRVLDLPSGKERCRVSMEVAGARPTPLAVSPGARVVAFGNFLIPDTIHLADGTTGKVTASLKDPELSLRWNAFTADGRTLFALCNGGIAQVWDVARGVKLRQFSLTGEPPANRGPRDGSPYYYAAVSPDGRWVAYAGEDHRLSLLDAATGELVWRQDGINCENGLFAFSPDGRMLAWNSHTAQNRAQDPVIHLLEVASGKERCSFSGHTGCTNSFSFSADGTALVTAGMDATALVWDLTGGRTAAAGREKPLTAAELDACWAALAAADAAAAYAALQRLAASPNRAVTYLGGRLSPVAAADAKALDRILTDLDSDTFDVREKAAADLEALADAAVPVCREALAGRPSAEVRRSLESFLGKRSQAWRTPPAEMLRMLRALEVLERAATPEARRLLQTLAGGMPQARTTVEAKGVLERLAGRQSAGRTVPATSPNPIR
jgi:RNA polymerase sigma factor (sigma-70 family)